MAASTAWKLAARACGPGRVTIRARSNAGAAWGNVFTEACSSSPAEVTLLGLAHALSELRRLGATSVRMAVTDPTLDGYLHRGWKPRRPAMVEATRCLVDAAAGLDVVFIPMLERRGVEHSRAETERASTLRHNLNNRRVE